MLTHIVLFQFSDAPTAQSARDHLLGLSGAVPSLRDLEAGIGDSGTDVALITRFDDKAGLEAYRVHPKHQEVVNFIKVHATDRRVVDFVST